MAQRSCLLSPRLLLFASYCEHRAQEESYLTVMLAKFIAQIDLIDSKQLNVTEQSVMLSCYASRDSVAKLCVCSERPTCQSCA